MKNNILRTILTYLGILLIMINYSICLKYGFSETLLFFEIIFIICIACLWLEYSYFEK